MLSHPYRSHTHLSVSISSLADRIQSISGALSRHSVPGDETVRYPVETILYQSFLHRVSELLYIIYECKVLQFLIDFWVCHLELRFCWARPPHSPCCISRCSFEVINSICKNLHDVPGQFCVMFLVLSFLLGIVLARIG